PGVPDGRHGRPRAALERLLRQARPGLRGGDRARRIRSSRPALPPGAPGAARRAPGGLPPRGPGGDLQPDQRRPLRDGPAGPDALGLSGDVYAVGRRVGHLHRSDRRDPLSLRARRALGAGASEAGGGRGALSVPVPASWVWLHPYLRPMADLWSRLEAALSELPVPPVPVPAWEAY